MKKLSQILAPLLIAAGLFFLFLFRPAPKPAHFELANNFSVSGLVAEIVSASPDGKTLVYTDSEARQFGWVDISNPSKPRMLGTYQAKQEPTSVAVTTDGKWALGVVDDVPGRLDILDMKTRKLQREITFAGQPDCIVVSKDGRFAAIAIENQRDDEDIPMPNLPAGYLLIVDLKGEPAGWSTRRVELTGLKVRFPTDPEPEYIAINDKNEAAITLQENNGVAIVNLENGQVLDSWSCGEVSHKADLHVDGKPELKDDLKSARREPDGIAWTPQGNLIMANEGDYSQDVDKDDNTFVGGRGFTVFSRDGEVLFDSGDGLEREAIRAGVYDDERSEKRGVEAEGVTVMKQGQSTLAFVGCEYGNGAAMYDFSNEAKPRFLQWLKGGSSPEGLLALPDHNLFITANEGDGTISIFQRL